MNGIFQEIRYAVRQLRKSPSFALIAILSLALGTGANTAIFQLLNAVSLKNLPISNPKELAEIRIVDGNKGFGVNDGPYAQLTRPVWEQIEQHHVAFSGVFAWDTQAARVGKGVDSHQVGGLEVTGGFFSVLGIQPWRGRLLEPSDEQHNDCTISRVVVSYPYWQSQMGGRELTGSETLLVEGKPAQVIGVTPPGFFGMAVGQSFDIAFPYCHWKDPHPELFNVAVMGRLQPGWTLERASAQMGSISSGIFEVTAPTGYSTQAVQQFKDYKLGVYSASGGVSLLRAVYESSLTLLLAIAGLVLLIACANLANLMLARASVREREVAVRMSLGASRFQLLRQSFIESALLAVIGTGLGVGFAQGLSRILVWSLSTQNFSVILSAGTDWHVLLFSSTIAVLTCMIFGIAPALRFVKAQPLAAMKSDGRGTTGSRERFSMQRSMVVVQISVSLVLLVGALLFVRSFRNIVSIDPGMREKGITLAYIGFGDSNIPPEHYEEFKRQLLDDVRSVPGVLNAAISTNVPLLGGRWGHNIHVDAAEGDSTFTWVSPNYFKMMQIPLQMGRSFSDNDTSTSTRVAVVNRAFIKKFLGGANPIGKTLRTDQEPNYPSTIYEVVDVIPDTKYSDIRYDTPPMVFAPASQFPAPAQRPGTAILIYSTVSPELAVKQKIAQAHPEIVMQFSNFQQDVRDGLVRERLLAMLSGFFGLLAALLTMMGLYGVISYIVARRRNEIGIRMALGAAREQVVSLMMREAGNLLLIGIAIGVIISLFATRSASSLLFGLKTNDPLTLCISVLLLSFIAGLASFIPARRAAKVDPMVALRYE